MTEERLPLAELLEKAGEGDFLRAVAEAVLQLLMETDVEGVIGAGRYERSGERTTWRNGYRDRVLDTRRGSLQLRVPKLRQGSYFPPFPEARKSSEKALITPFETIIVGYRRWLTFLHEHDLLDPTATPAARATPKNVAAYFRFLRTSNGNASVIARCSELRAALRIMRPELDFRWLTSPHGQSLGSLLPISRKPIKVINSKVLYNWGQTMMRDALLEANPEKWRIGYRNGLLIALFAARAPRVRSMASLRLGSTVIRNGNAYRLVFEMDDIKTGRSLEYDTPAGLSAAIDRYIGVERAELLMGKNCDAFWLDKYGNPLSADNNADMIHRQSKRFFGNSFGPHRFRHSMGTTAPLTDPARPGVAASVLGISGHMVEEHYNRASQADVVQKFQASLRKQWARLRFLAHREYQGADFDIPPR